MLPIIRALGRVSKISAVAARHAALRRSSPMDPEPQNHLCPNVVFFAFDVPPFFIYSNTLASRSYDGDPLPFSFFFNIRNRLNMTSKLICLSCMYIHENGTSFRVPVYWVCMYVGMSLFSGSRHEVAAA